MTQAAQAGMAMDNLDPLPDHDVAKDWKEGEDSGKGGLSIDDQEGNMVYLESIGEISDTTTAFVGMGYDHNLMATIYKLGGKLINVAFDAARLRKEEITDHGDMVRHLHGRRSTLVAVSRIAPSYSARKFIRAISSLMLIR